MTPTYVLWMLLTWPTSTLIVCTLCRVTRLAGAFLNVVKCANLITLLPSTNATSLCLVWLRADSAGAPESVLFCGGSIVGPGDSTALYRYDIALNQITATGTRLPRNVRLRNACEWARQTQMDHVYKSWRERNPESS